MQARNLARSTIDTELLMLSELFNYKITEVPIHWKDSCKETNVNLITDTIQMLIALNKQRIRKIKLKKEITGLT